MTGNKYDANQKKAQKKYMSDKKVVHIIVPKNVATKYQLLAQAEEKGLGSAILEHANLDDVIDNVFAKDPKRKEQFERVAKGLLEDDTNQADLEDLVDWMKKQV